MLCLLLPKASIFFCFRLSLFFPRENQLKKKNSRIENQRRKGRELITPVNSNSLLFPRTPPPKPWQARTRRQLNHSPRLSCPYIASSPVRHTDLRAGTFAAHTRSRVPQDLLRWGILKTIWRVVWYGGTYNSTGKQPLGYYPASAPAPLRLAVPWIPPVAQLSSSHLSNASRSLPSVERISYESTQHPRPFAVFVVYVASGGCRFCSPATLTPTSSEHAAEYQSLPDRFGWSEGES